MERTVRTLMQHGIVTEEGGGDVQAVPISALKVPTSNKLIECNIHSVMLCAGGTHSRIMTDFTLIYCSIVPVMLETHTHTLTDFTLIYSGTGPVMLETHSHIMTDFILIYCGIVPGVSPHL